MAGIYQADIYCDDCIAEIKKRLLTEGFRPNAGPEGNDTDDWPCWADDDEETDCPQHCRAGKDCCNALTVGEFKIGCLIGTSLTSEGMDYVKEAVQSGEGFCVELWRTEFDCIDFGPLRWEVAPAVDKLDRARVTELLADAKAVAIEVYESESLETLRAELVENVMDGIIEECEL